MKKLGKGVVTTTGLRSWRTSPGRAAVGVVLGSTLVAGSLAGCGSVATSTKPKSPQAAVTQGFGALGHHPNMAVSVSVTGSAASIAAMDQDDSASSRRDGVKFLTKSRFVIQFGSGNGTDLDNMKTGSGDPDAQFMMGSFVGSNAGFQLEYLKGNLYARVDLDQFKQFGAHFNSQAPFGKETGTITTLVPGLDQLLKGNWVEIPKSELAQVIKMSKNNPAITSKLHLNIGNKKANFTPAMVKNLEQAFSSAAGSNITAVKGGQSNGMTEYTVSTNLSNFTKTFLGSPQLAKAVAGTPLQSALAKLNPSKEAAKVKHPIIQSQVYTANGVVKLVKIKLTQFKPQLAPVWLQLGFSSPSALSAPSGATELNLLQVLKLASQSADQA